MVTAAYWDKCKVLKPLIYFILCTTEHFYLTAFGKSGAIKQVRGYLILNIL